MSEPAVHGAVRTADRTADWTAARRRDDGRRRRLEAPRGRAGGGAKAAAPAMRPGASLRLAAVDGRLVPRVSGRSAGVADEPIRTRGARTAARTPAPPPARRPARTPVRLTRRGRMVATAAAVLTIGAVSMALAGAAQAAGHSGTPGAPGRGMAKVLVRPGQSLWSLAEAYDPDADPRSVIQEILQLNPTATDQIQPGQLLWVPRG